VEHYQSHNIHNIIQYKFYTSMVIPFVLYRRKKVERPPASASHMPEIEAEPAQDNGYEEDFESNDDEVSE
jgi:hypothetical protein